MKIWRIIIVSFLSMAVLSSCGISTNQSGNKQSGNSGGNFKKPEKPKFKIPVTVTELKRGRMYSYIQALGTVVPIKEVEIKPEMGARIYYTKRWMEGNEVKKGEKFAGMDDRDLRIQIEEAQLQLEIAKESVLPAKAQLDQAIKDVEFSEAMLKRGAIPKTEYDQSALTKIQRQNTYEERLKNVRSREMSLEQLRQEQEKVDIYFPFDGVLLPAQQSLASSEREGNETDLTLLHGLMVASGTVLCRLADIDQVFVSLDLPAKDLLEVKIGQEVELEVYSRVGRTYRGVVKEISTALNASTRTYTINVLVKNPDHELRPGMFATGRIITVEKKDAIKVPRELVLLRNNRNIVFVAKEKPIEEDQKNDAPGEDGDASKNKNEPIADGAEANAAHAADLVDDATEDEEFIFGDGQNDEEEILYIAEEREVVTGIENKEFIEIEEGLKESEFLVVLGYETLTDEVEINITVRDSELQEIADSGSSN